METAVYIKERITKDPATRFRLKTIKGLYSMGPFLIPILRQGNFIKKGG
jgi:hypothetical protein